MPYKLNGRVITPGRSFKTATGMTVTNQWATVFTADQLAERGVTWEEPPVRSHATPFYNADGTAKDLAGCKTVQVEDQKQAAKRYLEPTDWYVTRKAEKGTDIPTNVVTYRDAVRTACAARESEINAAADVDTLKSLVETNPTTWDSENEQEIENPVAHLTPWPTL